MRFDNVDLGGRRVCDQVSAYRKNLAQQLQELLDDPEFKDVIYVDDLIKKLKKPIAIHLNIDRIEIQNEST